MRCKACHYSLANLTGPPHRCPECGSAFDPNDPFTFDSHHPALSTDAKVLGCLVLFITTWATFTLLNVLFVEQDFSPLHVRTALAAIALNLTAAVVFQRVRKWRAKP